MCQPDHEPIVSCYLIPQLSIRHRGNGRNSKLTAAAPKIYFLRPFSKSNRIASDRLTPRSAAHLSTRAMSASESRKPIIGRTPVAGRPRFFCLADIDWRVFLFSIKSKAVPSAAKASQNDRR
jgi:hypothetical protein